METFDLSECYSKLDQKELLRVVSDMIDMAFQGKNYLAVSLYEQTGRQVSVPGDRSFRETIYSADALKKDVQFLTTNAYIEQLGSVWKQVKGIPMGLGISPFLCDYFLLHWELIWCKTT